MVSLTQSPFLQALGYAIINSLWQFALLWLIYTVVNTTFKLSSHKSYATALMLQVIGFGWFIGTLLYYYHFCIQLLPSTQTAGIPYAKNVVELSSFATLKENVYNFLIQAEHLLPYLSMAYLFLIVFLTVKMANGFSKSIRLRSEGLIKSGVEWRLFVQRISFELGVKRKVQLYLSYLVESPVTIGFFKPIILLPVAAVNNLNTEQLEAVLLHELVHIKRHDYLINLLVLLIEIALFFNPFMQLLSKHIKRERENSCDDWVLQYEYSASSYAKALLKLASGKLNSCPQFAMAATDNKRALLNRVKRMIEKKENPFDYRQQLVALLFMTALFVSVAWYVPAKIDKVDTSRTAKSTKMAEAVTPPVLSTVDNPFFNPVYFLTKSINEKEAQSAAVNNRQLQKEIANAGTKKTQVEGKESNTIRTEARKKPVEFRTASLNTPENDLFKSLSIDTALLNIELKKLSSMNFFENVDFKPFQASGNETNSSLDANRRATSTKLYEIEKAQKQAVEAIEEFSKLKTKYYQNWRKLNGTTIRKEQQPDKSNDESVESETLIKSELKSLSDKIRSLEVLNKMRLLIEKPARHITYEIDMPAVFYTPEYKPVKSYSYEYKVSPKSQLIITSKVLSQQVKTQPKNECKVIADDEECIKQNVPPVAPQREVRTSVGRRLYIVHI